VVEILRQRLEDDAARSTRAGNGRRRQSASR
jgi:hypothetical protein